MGKFFCREHGRIRRVAIGQKPNYCPLCGKHAIPIFFIPKIYIDKSVVILLGCVLGAAVVGAGVYLPVSYRMRDTDQKVQQLHPIWRNLYESMDAVSAGNESEVCKEFIRVNQEDLRRAPSLTQNDIQVLTRANGSANKMPVIKMLLPYTVGSQTGEPIR